ncbi:tandem-95 repeat protein, partial [Methylobacter svalbardensis]|uniref:tandem-95 repeat protein n=1 Tax=Methylobacter svalbardensis TaxID=3080016 RepID=UPI0030ED799C
ANNDALTTAEDTPLTIAASALTGNDSDPEGDTYSITGFTQTSNGTLAQDGDGSFTYTPNANYNGGDSFTYTITDSQGATDTATVTINVTPVNDVAPTIGTSSLSVSEEGLVAGVKDTTGSNDTTDLATRTSTIAITGTAPLTAELSLVGLPTTLKSGGVVIAWSYDSDNPAIILGKAGSELVIQITLNGGSTAVTPASTALSYTVALLGPVDHALTNVEDTLSFNVGVTLSDGSNPVASSRIGITIEDDMPVLTNIESLVVGNSTASTIGTITGLSFGADHAASTGAFTLTSTPKLEGITNILSDDGKTLTASINGLNNVYDSTDAVFYTVTLSDNSTYTFNLVTPQPTQLIPLNFAQVTAGGPQEMVTLTAGTNSVTFDGLQFNPTTFAPINSTSSNVDDINANSIGFGIGNGNVDDNEGFSASVVQPVDGMQFTVVAAAGNIDATTIYWKAFAADGTTVVDSGTISLTGLKNVASSQVVSIQSDVEFNIIEVRFDHPDSNDAVRIQGFSLIDKIVPSDLALNFTATATDGDGDQVSASFSVNVDSVPTAVDDITYTVQGTDGDGDSVNGLIGATLYPAQPTISGTAGNDTLTGDNADNYLLGGDGDDILSGNGGDDLLVGGAGNDTLTGGNGNDILIGGTGNDILTGGASADVFKWNLADKGEAGNPAHDIVTDFGNGNNVLDLRDLLTGEHDTSLANYLHFDKSGSDTVISVTSNGGNGIGENYDAGKVDQTITLEAVDLVTGYDTQAAMIQSMLDSQKLITDN